VCDKVAYDTVTVYAYPLSNVQFAMNPNRVQLKVWPNPATNVVTISVNNLSSQPVYISNTSGQIVYQQNLHQPTTNIDISQWASGVYFVRYADAAKKLVVQ
jgi:tryptophanase